MGWGWVTVGCWDGGRGAVWAYGGGVSKFHVATVTRGKDCLKGNWWDSLRLSYPKTNIFPQNTLISKVKIFGYPFFYNFP